MTITYNNGTLARGDPTLPARVITLENVLNEYEIYYSVVSGTSGTITYPAGSTLVLGEYAGQNAIVTVLDANGRPIDQAAKTAAGAVITATLGVGGSYTLSGAPSAYPVGLVYQIRCSTKDSSNVPLASIIDVTQVQGTMAKQDANSVAITGGTINSVSIGATTASTGRFTTVTAAGLIYSTLNGFKFPDGTVQTTSASLEAGPAFTYTSGVLTRVDYDSGNYKTFTYTSGVLTQVDYIVGAITTRKTFNYNLDGSLASVDQTVI